MVCVAAESVAVANVALPEASTTPVPSVVAPSLKVTVPPGMPTPGEITVTFAVNVIDEPTIDGLLDEMSVVVVPAMLTVCEVVFDVLAPKFASPA